MSAYYPLKESSTSTATSTDFRQYHFCTCLLVSFLHWYDNPCNYNTLHGHLWDGDLNYVNRTFLFNCSTCRTLHHVFSQTISSQLYVDSVFLLITFNRYFIHLAVKFSSEQLLVNLCFLWQFYTIALTIFIVVIKVGYSHLRCRLWLE